MIHTSDQDLLLKYLNDPSTSSWFKAALKASLERDPVDALNDAQVLWRVLKMRWENIRAVGSICLICETEISPASQDWGLVEGRDFVHSECWVLYHRDSSKSHRGTERRPLAMREAYKKANGL